MAFEQTYEHSTARTDRMHRTMQQDVLGELGQGLTLRLSNSGSSKFSPGLCLSVLVFSKLGGYEDQTLSSISQELGQQESNFTSQEWDLNHVAVSGRRFKDPKHLWRPLIDNCLTRLQEVPTRSGPSPARGILYRTKTHNIVPSYKSLSKQACPSPRHDKVPEKLFVVRNLKTV